MTDAELDDLLGTLSDDERQEALAILRDDPRDIVEFVDGGLTYQYDMVAGQLTIDFVALSHYNTLVKEAMRVSGPSLLPVATFLMAFAKAMDAYSSDVS